VPSRVRDSPAKPTGGESRAAREWPPGGAKLNDEGKARSLRDLFAEGRALPAESAESGPTWRARPPPRAGDPPPQDCGGPGVLNERRGFSGGGTRRAAAT